MPSSVVASIKYNYEDSTLRIIYRSGSIYDYLNVEAAIYESMKAASSKGTYLNQHILGKYEFERVK